MGVDAVKALRGKGVKFSPQLLAMEPGQEVRAGGKILEVISHPDLEPEERRPALKAFFPCEFQAVSLFLDDGLGVVEAVLPAELAQGLEPGRIVFVEGVTLAPIPQEGGEPVPVVVAWKVSLCS